jgi:hypothetical protein
MGVYVYKTDRQKLFLLHKTVIKSQEFGPWSQNSGFGFGENVPFRYWSLAAVVDTGLREKINLTPHSYWNSFYTLFQGSRFLNFHSS